MTATDIQSWCDKRWSPRRAITPGISRSQLARRRRVGVARRLAVASCPAHVGHAGRISAVAAAPSIARSGQCGNERRAARASESRLFWCRISLEEDRRNRISRKLIKCRLFPSRAKRRYLFRFVPGNDEAFRFS